MKNKRDENSQPKEDTITSAISLNTVAKANLKEEIDAMEMRNDTKSNYGNAFSYTDSDWAVYHRDRLHDREYNYCFEWDAYHSKNWCIWTNCCFFNGEQ